MRIILGRTRAGLKVDPPIPPRNSKTSKKINFDDGHGIAVESRNQARLEGATGAAHHRISFASNDIHPPIFDWQRYFMRVSCMFYRHESALRGGRVKGLNMCHSARGGVFSLRYELEQLLRLVYLILSIRLYPFRRFNASKGRQL